jgi:exopolysaccharide biosynthesis protein
VVDGRRPGKAEGMTAKELTMFLKKHFAARWALNMDGGGSSTMCIKGKGAPNTNVVNYPTDNNREDHYGQRSVCTHLIVKTAG